MLRLIITPDHSRPGAFSAHLEDGSPVVASSRQPLVDSFARSAPVGQLAEVTYSEGEKTPLRKARYRAVEDALQTGDCRCDVQPDSAIRGGGRTLVAPKATPSVREPAAGGAP